MRSPLGAVLAAPTPPTATWLDHWTPPAPPAPDLHVLAQDPPPGPPINPDDLPDVAPMADAHAQALTDLSTKWADLTDAQKQQLVDQIRDAAQRGHLTDLTNLQVDTTPAAAALTAAMVAAALAASRLLAAEAADQGVTVAVQHLGPAAFQPVAQVVTDLLADELRITAARAALRTGPDATPAEVAATAQQALDDLTTASADKQLGGTIHGAMNAGRIATLRRAPEGTLYASEKNDRNTCLAPDVAVTTRHGAVYAKDVTLDDELLTHSGQWIRPSRIVVSEVQEELVRIGLGDGRTLRLTRDHPVLVRTGVGFAWRLAGDLAVGDLVVDQTTLKVGRESGRIDLVFLQSPDRVSPVGEVSGFPPIDVRTQRVPVRAVCLDYQTLTDEEVSDPRPDLGLGSVPVSEVFEDFADVPFDSGLGAAGQVATPRAVPLPGGDAWDDPDLGPAVGTGDDDWRAPARLAAVSPHLRTRMSEGGVAAPAGCVDASRGPAALDRTVVVPASGGYGDAELGLAVRADFGNAAQRCSDLGTQLGVGELAFARAVDGAGLVPTRDFAGADFAGRRRVVRTSVAPSGESATASAAERESSADSDTTVHTRPVHDLSVVVRTVSITEVVRESYDGEVYDFSVPGDETFWAEGVLVHNCKPCREVNGRWLGNISDLDQTDRHPADRTGVLALYPDGAYGGYIYCLGGVNCRGTIVGVWRPAQAGPGDTYAKFNPEQPRRSDGKWGTGGVERELEKLAAAAGGQDALDAAPAKLIRAPNGHHGDYTGEGLTGPAGMGSARALSEYEGLEYQETNTTLRGGYNTVAPGDPSYERMKPFQDEREKAVAQRVAEIDKTMAVSRLTSDVAVDRIIKSGSDTFGHDTWYGHVIDWHSTDYDAQDKQVERWEAGDRPDLTGLRWTDAGYVSTSADPSAVERFGGRWRESNSALEGEPAIMTILAPKGTGGVQLSEWGHDAEILLERGLTYEVLADHGVDSDGFRRLDVGVVTAHG